MKPAIKIPDDCPPSTFVRLALDCLELAEKDPRYVVDMCFFHEPQQDGCHVCWAGAVMAFGLGSDPQRAATPWGYEAYRLKLFGLDGCRSYFGSWGLEKLGVAWLRTYDLIRRFRDEGDPEIPRYENDPESWKDEMRRLADLLESEGY